MGTCMSFSMTSQWCSSLSRKRSLSSSSVCVSKSVSKSAFFTSLLPSMRLHTPMLPMHADTLAKGLTNSTAAADSPC